MRTIKLLLTIFTIFIYSYGFSQKDAIDLAIDKMRAKHPVPEISKEQMRIDFDKLIKIIKNNDAQLIARQKVTGIDIIEEISALKKEIDTISNLDNFIVLVYRAIRLTQDPHASNGYDVYYFNHTYYKKDCKRLGLKDTEFSYNFKYNEIIYDNFDFILGFIYNNKKYYLKSDLNIYTNNDSIIITKGSEIVSLNNLSIDSFISKYRSYQEGLRWDFSNNSFYVTELSKPTNLIITSITINDKNGVSNKIECDSFLFMQKEFKPRIYGKPKVHFFSEDSILYIRCPLMSVYRSKYYKEEILKHNASNIKNIIIDVRENYGGNDQTWMNILSYISDKPIETRVAMALSTDIDRDQLTRKERRTLKEIQIPALDNTSYLILQDEIEVIKPDKKSINYDGKIYIMQDQDIYSSTGSLTATALKYDNLISIGMTTGKLLGRGINPGIFILPNSKFIVKLPTVIDFTDINNAKDVYHDSVEVVFDLPISYHLKMANDDNLYSKEYLIKEDVFFNKIRLYIKNNY